MNTFVIKCNDKTIQLELCQYILIQRSNYFKKMFSNFQETKLNKVEIILPEFKASNVQQFFKFMMDVNNMEISYKGWGLYETVIIHLLAYRFLWNNMIKYTQERIYRLAPKCYNDVLFEAVTMMMDRFNMIYFKNFFISLINKNKKNLN